MENSKPNPLHILFLPFMAPGHMIPMLDLAKLFTSHGVKSTFLTTHGNAPLVRPTIDHFNSISTHLPITLLLIPFPSAEAGLPPGVENGTHITSTDMRAKFFHALSLLRQTFDQVLREQLVDAVVTDGFFTWSYDSTAELGVPLLVFYGTGAFTQCATDSIIRHDPMSALEEEDETVVIPGLPHKIEMLRTQMVDRKQRPDMWKNGINMHEMAQKSFGEVANTFYDLESHYVEHYRKSIGRRGWFVGPVSLCNQDAVNKSQRGDKASIDCDECLNWLDGKKPGSVLYVSFGTMSQLSEAQLREIAIGLDASGKDFIWVIRGIEGEGLDWLPEGLKERILRERRGLIIRGWAPQLLILNHSAVGAFLTHCGWNSCLEGVAAGVPFITWPLYADQFFNEKVLVEIEKVGVAIGAKDYASRLEERSLIMGGAIENAVEKVMDEGEEAEGMRRRVRELAKKAKRAVEEGGSSHADLKQLIEELSASRNAKLK